MFKLNFTQYELPNKSKSYNKLVINRAVVLILQILLRSDVFPISQRMYFNLHVCRICNLIWNNDVYFNSLQAV